MKDNWRGLPELVEYARERNSYVYFNTVWSPKELALWYQGARKLKEVCEFYSRFSFAGPDLVDIVNQRNFRGFVSLLNSWQEFMQCYDDADLDFRDSIENPEQNSHAIAKALRENKQFREGVNRTNPFGVDIEKFLESHSHMSELMGGYF